MREYPKGGLIGKSVHLFRRIAALHISIYAANASYFIVMSFFPCLLLFLGLLRYTPLEVERLGEMLYGLLPAVFAEEAEALILTTYDSASGTMLGISAVAALWSGNRGIYGIVTGLNAIYGAQENRSYLHRRLISTGYTLAFLMILLLTLGLHVFTAGFLQFLSRCSHPAVRLLLDFINLRFFLLLFLQSGIFTLMFMVLPNKKNSFWDSLPGALLASCGWLIFSNLFSVYMEHYGNRSGIYGSVTALAMGMLWLYCCISMVFYGGALNVFASRWKNVS